MSTTIFGLIKNYEVYTCPQVDSKLLEKKESFQLAVERLVDALNTYTESKSAKVVKILIDNIQDDITRNRYTYFDIGGSTVGEKETRIYVFKFTWDPFHSIELNEVRTTPISSIGLYTGCVRWEHNDFHAMYPVEFSDDITYNQWLNCACINKIGGCFYDLNEYLFHIFADSYYEYRDSLLYLGYDHKKDFIGGQDVITAAFKTASKLLSKYPKGIKHNESNECSKVDWYYHTLDLVFKELGKEDTMDTAYFYEAMRDYVKEIEKTKFASTTEMNEE